MQYFVYVWVDVPMPESECNHFLATSCLTTSCSLQPQDAEQGKDKKGTEKKGKRCMDNGKDKKGKSMDKGKDKKGKSMDMPSSSSWSMDNGKGHGQLQERWMPNPSSWSMGTGKGHGQWFERHMPSSSFGSMGSGKGKGEDKKGKSMDMFDSPGWDWSGDVVPEYNADRTYALV